MTTKDFGFAIILAALAGIGAVTVDRYYFRPGEGSIITSKSCKLKTDMRKLWADHVIWTREFIVSKLSGSQDNKEVTDRLLKNQVDIGDAIAQYYGTDAGNALAALLKDHILLAAEVVAAAQANDQEKLKDADARWHKNAEDMTYFLNKANPNSWSVDDLTKMFNDHLRLTTGEAVARIKKEWKNDVQAFDNIFNQIMDMADMLTKGIIAQFPNKF